MKNAITILLFFVFAKQGITQDFMHSFGMYPSFADGVLQYQGSRQEVSLFVAAVTYFPRYNFAKFENRTLSVGIPLGAGPAIIGPELDYHRTFAITMPLVLDYNIAYKSTPENNQLLGCYIGAGFSFSKAFINKNDFQDFNGLSFGPLLRAGVRVPPPGWFLNPELGYSIGAFYQRGMHKYNFNAFGIMVMLEW